MFFPSGKSVQISGVARVESHHEMTIGLKVGYWYSVADVIGTSVPDGSWLLVRISGVAGVGYSVADVIGTSGAFREGVCF